MSVGAWEESFRRTGVSGQQLDRLLEHNPAIVYTCTLGRLWTFSYVSPNVRRVLGFEAEEILSDPALWLSRLHPADRPRLPERGAVSLLAEGSRIWEYRFKHRDGGYRWLQNEVRLLPEADPIHEPFECTGYCIDITERKNAEAAWRDSEARFEAFMRNSPAIAFLKDEEGRFVYANPAFVDSLGLSSSGWVGQTAHDLWPAEVAGPIQVSDREVLTTGLPKAVEEALRGPGGERVFFTLKFPLRDGGRTLLAGMGIDATERRFLQQRFVATQPAASALPAQPGSHSAPLDALPSGTETVLLVEDELLVRELAKRILVRQGYRVLEAASGPEAIRVAEAHAAPLHLLLTDVVMPGLGGPEIVKRLRGRYPDLRVIFMSGYAESAIFETRALTPGENFVLKPFSPQDLLKIVRATLDGLAPPVRFQAPRF